MATAERTFEVGDHGVEAHESRTLEDPGPIWQRKTVVIADGQLGERMAARHRRRQKMRWAHAAAPTRRSSKYVYETGTTTSVRIVAVVMPPTRVLPKGP